MKKKFKLLSLVSALAIGATMTFSACSGKDVGEHEHEWDEGAVTTQSTCSKEGVKTYSCKVDGCKQKKTEPIAMIAHSWNEGEVTTQPTCSKEGVKKYTCTADGCGKTKEEAVEKTEHTYDEGKITIKPDLLIKGKKTLTCVNCNDKKDESVEARADFSEQFYTALTEQNNWRYGYANSYDTETGEVDFVRIEQAEDNAWKNENTEISNGYVYSANNAVIAYSITQEIPEYVQTGVSVSFAGEESTTRLNAYLIITDSEGALKQAAELNSANAKDWTYKTEQAVDIAQGDTIYLVFDNKGEGKAGGDLTFTLTPPCVHVWDNGTVTTAATCTADGEKVISCIYCDKKLTEVLDKIPHDYKVEITTEATEDHAGEKTYTCKSCGDTYTEEIPQLITTVFNGANFAEDFELNATGEFAGWEVGVVNYDFPTETFSFTKISTLNENEDAYHSDDPWIDIKGNWMAANGMMGFAYHFYSTANVNVDFNLQCVQATGKYALRWAVKDKDGNIKNNEGKAQWGKDGNEIAFNQNISVEYGDVLYLLLGKDGDGDQSNFDITLTKITKFADFGEDFADTLAGNTGWKVGYASYDFPSETFGFTEITTVNNGDTYHNGDPWIDINSGLIASKAMVGIAYEFSEALNAKFNFAVTCKDDGLCAVRWAVKDSSGAIKNGGQASWGGSGSSVTLDENIDVAAGDVLYILVGFEADGNENRSDQKDFTLTLSKR